MVISEYEALALERELACKVCTPPPAELFECSTCERILPTGYALAVHSLAFRGKCRKASR